MLETLPFYWQIAAGSAAILPTQIVVLFFDSVCLQTVARMMVDFFDHLSQQLSLTPQGQVREWTYIALADTSLLFNLGKLH